MGKPLHDAEIVFGDQFINDSLKIAQKAFGTFA